MGDSSFTPIAVIGMACRLPGGIGSPEQLWDALIRGDDLVVEIPADRWDAEEYYDPEPGVAGRSVSKYGAFLDDVGGFDAEFFGISEREATAIDPQHRVLLETAWEAVERAGFNPAALAGSKLGVFAGVTHNDYAYLAAESGSLEGPYGFTGTSFSLASGRIAYALGARGPALTVDTACSSGLTAVHLACHSLLDGESDIALAGGVSILLEPRKAASGSAAGMLSPSGRCRAFDIGADGFVSAEGSVMLVLKRLPEAQRDGDEILAVVRGVASNQDGRTVNIATPSSDAQIAVYQAALDVAGVDADTVGMVEAHGTGTPVGDPLEYASVAAVYGNAGPCALTSVKTNFGHTQSAAGALGLMKAVLAVRHGVVPPNLHFTALPDELAAVPTELFVPTSDTPWPTNGARPRRAAVSSYGLSGTNVHAILEQSQVSAPEPVDAAASPEHGPLLIPLSASSSEALCRTARDLADWVTRVGVGAADGPALVDIGYTLARRRGFRSVRATAVAKNADELLAALNEVADGAVALQPAVGQDDRGPVWVFLGAGLAMGRDGYTVARDRTGVRRKGRRARAADRRGIGILGDRGHVGLGDRDRNRSDPADHLYHAGRAGGGVEITRRGPGCGDRPLDGRGGRRGGCGCALAARRRACHLSSFPADAAAGRRWRHGIGRIACRPSPFGACRARYQ